MSLNTELMLASSRWGRIVLHAISPCRDIRGLRWHWAGIMREVKHV